MTPRTGRRAPGPALPPPPPADRTLPAAAVVLGIAGTVPFVAATAAIVLGSSPIVRIYGYIALISYGACMLSFLGAVHCGLALRQAPLPVARLAASGLPPLLAWISLALGERTGLMVMAASYLGVLACDIAAARRGWAPVWYPRLRWPLTGVTLVCLMAAMQVQPG